MTDVWENITFLRSTLPSLIASLVHTDWAVPLKTFIRHDVTPAKKEQIKSIIFDSGLHDADQ